MAWIDNLRPFTERDLAILEEWFEDREVYRRLEGMLPLGEWYGHVEQQLDYSVWAASFEDNVVGVIMIEREEQETGSVALVVRPAFRGLGYGRALIERAMQLPELATIRKWYAGIEADNTACLRCFQSTGFVMESETPDEDGYCSLWHIKDAVK
ncbi:GNAT family N-acetyltransferase [Paenibacillus fonticola]|uniref:GNAT family N-acetyltransferase n=1 Tax=Paenibacillus fonticola TaxID=379896 RepID=UPI00036FE570|nr:GNAT family N-acetyltransferase [Paenibacillus fonticola]